MNATRWLPRRHDRPPSGRERRTVIATVAVLLAAIALTIALPDRGSLTEQPRIATDESATRPRHRPPARLADPSTEAKRIAERFASGYLAYVYARASAGQIQDATAMLAHRLRGLRPPVSESDGPVPRVLALDPTSAPAGETGVAVVVGRGIVRYTLKLLLAPQDGRLMVTTVESH